MHFRHVRDSELETMTEWCTETFPLSKQRIWAKCRHGFRFRRRLDAEMFRLAFSDQMPCPVQWERGGVVNWWGDRVFSTDTPDWQLALLAGPVLVVVLPIMLPIMLYLDAKYAIRRWRSA